jgi:hypothetical protein
MSRRSVEQRALYKDSISPQRHFNNYIFAMTFQYFIDVPTKLKNIQLLSQ